MSEVTIKIEIPGLTDLIGALNAHTAAISGGETATATKEPAAAKSAPAKSSPAKGKPASKPKATKAEVSAALGEVKSAFGIEAARAIMQENGGFSKMADITPEYYDAIVAAAAEQISAAEAGTDNSEDDGL